MAAKAMPPIRTNTPKITVTNSETATVKTKTNVQPKSPETLPPLAPKKSLTSMSDEEIIQENLKEILDNNSREERKANGRLIAVILAFLVIFLALYHACSRNMGALAGVLVPAGIMLSYAGWVVILAKRDKHKRELFERHIEEVALKNKSELEEKHTRLKQLKEQQKIGSAATTLQFVNELTLGADHRKKTRRHRQRHREESAEITVHRSHIKRPSIRQKLFGQAIAHVKLVEVHTENVQKADTKSPTLMTDEATTLSQKRKRMQRMDTLAMPQVVRMSSAP